MGEEESPNEYRGDQVGQKQRQFNHPVFPFKERNQGKLFATPEACQQYFMKYQNTDKKCTIKYKNAAHINIDEGCSNSSRGITSSPNNNLLLAAAPCPSSNKKTPASRNKRNNLFQSSVTTQNTTSAQKKLGRKSTSSKSKLAQAMSHIQKHTDSSSRKVLDRQGSTLTLLFTQPTDNGFSYGQAGGATSSGEKRKHPPPFGIGSNTPRQTDSFLSHVQHTAASYDVSGLTASSQHKRVPNAVNMAQSLKRDTKFENACSRDVLYRDQPSHKLTKDNWHGFNPECSLNQNHHLDFQKMSGRNEKF